MKPFALAAANESRFLLAAKRDLAANPVEDLLRPTGTSMQRIEGGSFSDQRFQRTAKCTAASFGESKAPTRRIRVDSALPGLVAEYFCDFG